MDHYIALAFRPDWSMLETQKEGHTKMPMSIYRKKLIALFKSGKATRAQWKALTEGAILASEAGDDSAKVLEDAIGLREASLKYDRELLARCGLLA
jgi:hypothetical protein